MLGIVHHVTGLTDGSNILGDNNINNINSVGRLFVLTVYVHRQHSWIRIMDKVLGSTYVRNARAREMSSQK